MPKKYHTKEEVLETADRLLSKTFRELLSEEEIKEVEERLREYGTNRKGYFGDLVEKCLFGIENNNRSEPDLQPVGVELKTTPLVEHKKLRYAAKERLVFSMINYRSIINEGWENSSFLEKNKRLLILFYLYTKEQLITDYEFKFRYFIDLMEDVSSEDALQIRKDWEYIVERIRRGEAHLLSEAQTFYLGACTKAANNRVVRDQAEGFRAKPRAFAFKQQYLNYLLQKKILKQDVHAESLLKRMKKPKTIENFVTESFARFIGRTDKEIMDMVDWHPTKSPKNFKRLLANRMLGVTSNKVEEFEKANVTLKVVTLEHTGTLKESLSFPAFDYKGLLKQKWYDEEDEMMADFHEQLETKRFLFVVFQKVKDSDDVVLKRTMFWNFSMEDLPEAERVWRNAVECIKEGRYSDLPKMSESPVAHVRPHGENAKDTIETPQGTQEIKRCFWLNAKYIQKVLNSG